MSGVPRWWEAWTLPLCRRCPLPLSAGCPVSHGLSCLGRSGSPISGKGGLMISTTAAGPSGLQAVPSEHHAGGTTSPEPTAYVLSGRVSGPFVEENVRRSWHPGVREMPASLPLSLCSCWGLRARRAVPGPSTLLSQVPRFSSHLPNSHRTLLCSCLAPATFPALGLE